MKFSSKTKLKDIMEAEEFQPFGRFLFPSGFLNPEHSMKVEDMGRLMPWHTEIHEEETLTVLRYMDRQVQEGKPLFFDIYSEEEKKEDPTRRDTGLFYFPGVEGAPAAVLAPGGGFVYVGAMQDSFPLALSLSEKGIHAFSLQYRTVSAHAACEDMARAVAFLFQKSQELGIDMRGYSLWGSSAGARLAAYLGETGPSVFGEPVSEKPAAVIMQYTGYGEAGPHDVPAFACVGDLDGIADWRIMKERIRKLRQYGIPAAIHVYHGLRHGFGLGLGTPAEGWEEEAAAFWKEQRNRMAELYMERKKEAL